MSVEKDEKWQEAVRQHLDAVRDFVDVAAKYNPDGWLRSMDAGKWSPAEITEHLKLVYEGFLRELREGNGIKIQSSWLMRSFLRLAILPRIFKSGRLPKGAKSPSEVRPITVIEDRQQALTQFSLLAEEFQSELAKRMESREPRLTHHLFGQMNGLEGLRFVTIHIVHHQKQLPG